MKHMKKLWALLLALVMVLALGVTASATKPTSEPKMKYRVDYTEYAEGGMGIKGGVFTMTNTADSTKVFEATSNENGVAVFENLPVGTYTLTQKTAPLGYEKAFCTNYKEDHATSISVTVANGKVTADNGSEVYDGVYAVFDKDSSGSKCYQWETATEASGYYVPALFQSKKAPIATVEIPFTKVVKLGGNANAGSQKFELEIFNSVNSTDGLTITSAVETNGSGTYESKLVITGPEAQVNTFISGSFYVREKNTGAANWGYSNAVWYVLPVGTKSGISFTIYPTEKKTSANGEFYEYDRNNPVTQMTFTNTYTQNVTYTRPAQPTETKIGSPKTFDAGIGLYAVSALLSVTGGAWVVGKKRK